MNEQLFIQMTAGSAVLECPDGKEICVRSILLGITSATGAQAIVEWSRDGQFLFRTSTSQMLDSVTSVSAFVGAGDSAPMEEEVDPVTGAVSFILSQDAQQMPMPELWMNRPVTLTASMAGGGAIDSASVFYERRKA